MLQRRKDRGFRGPDGKEYNGTSGITLYKKEDADALVVAFQGRNACATVVDLTDTSRITSPETKAVLDMITQSGVYETMGRYRVRVFFDDEKTLHEVFLEVLGIDLENEIPVTSEEELGPDFDPKSNLDKT